ncbi:unnamed protein product [Cylicocyclus nassatus]|uniref:Uncharacterized protein n=1 Tax=Cylicocyclus nassatus TaxID=53992 RepID=A0AA36GIH9_CYLNA|nr:unnamed protein product [Cylicocyclus nassatus]
MGYNRTDPVPNAPMLSDEQDLLDMRPSSFPPTASHHLLALSSCFGTDQKKGGPLQSGKHQKMYLYHIKSVTAERVSGSLAYAYDRILKVLMLPETKLGEAIVTLSQFPLF